MFRITARRIISRVLYLRVSSISNTDCSVSPASFKTRREALKSIAFPSYIGIAPNRVYTGKRRYRLPGELLPHLFTVTGCPDVIFCCTFPEVALGGRYPLFFPVGARTFLRKSFLPFPRSRVLRAGYHSSSNLCSRLYDFFAVSFSLPDLSRLSRRLP